jgi:hypothetical protein
MAWYDYFQSPTSLILNRIYSLEVEVQTMSAAVDAVNAAVAALSGNVADAVAVFHAKSDELKAALDKLASAAPAEDTAALAAIADSIKVEADKLHEAFHPAPEVVVEPAPVVVDPVAVEPVAEVPVEPTA